MRDQSHIDEMRAAVRGDRERAQARREAEQQTVEPSPPSVEPARDEPQPALMTRLLFWRT